MGHISWEELLRMKVNDKETKEWIEDVLSDDYYVGYFEAKELDLVIKGVVCTIPYFKMRMICEYLNEVNKTIEEK